MLINHHTWADGSCSCLCVASLPVNPGFKEKYSIFLINNGCKKNICDNTLCIRGTTVKTHYCPCLYNSVGSNQSFAMLKRAHLHFTSTQLIVLALRLTTLWLWFSLQGRVRTDQTILYGWELFFFYLKDSVLLRGIVVLQNVSTKLNKCDRIRSETLNECVLTNKLFQF